MDQQELDDDFFIVERKCLCAQTKLVLFCESHVLSDLLWHALVPKKQLGVLELAHGMLLVTPVECVPEE